MKYKKSMYLILGLGIVVPAVTFSAISLSQHYSKKKTLSEADKIKFLNKIIAKINSQPKVPLLMSDYFDGNADKEKQEFIKKFKIYLTNSYGSSKFNIDDITSWIDFEDIKAEEIKDNDKFSKLIKFSIKIKYATQKTSVNFVFYQSMASSSKNKQALLDKIKKEIINKEGIYKLTNFKKVAFKLVKEMGQLQKETNKITTALQPTPAKLVNIKKTLNDLADNYSKLNNVNKTFVHNITQYSNYQRVYYKNDIGVFLLRVKDSNGKTTSGKFAIYDYASKSELIAPTLIDDFDGGESKHFKILNNNLFYTSEKGDTEYLNYIDLSTQNTIQNPNLEIYNDYDMEIVPYYSGSDEVLIIQHNANGGGTKKIAFDVVNKKVIFDFNKNAHGSDNLLFRISQNKNTLYFNKRNGNNNDINIYKFNGTKFAFTSLVSKVYRIRGTKTFKEAFINNKLVKNVTLSILQKDWFKATPKKVLIIYEEGGQLKHEVVEYTNPDNWSILTNEKFYLHKTKKDVATWVFKNKDFIYISTKTNKATLGQKSTAISNKLAFVKAKQELMDLIVQSFVDYQKRIQKWLYEKYFILYNGLKSPQGMIKSGIQVKIDEDKIRNSLLKTFNNYDFTKINVKAGDETYALDLDLDKLSNFMSVTYKDIAGNVSKKQNIDFNNKDDQGKSKKTWELTLYKNWEDIYNRVNKAIQNNLNNAQAFKYQASKKINMTNEDYYKALTMIIQNNLTNIIRQDMGSYSNARSYQIYFKLIVNGTPILIYADSDIDAVVQKIISKEKGIVGDLFGKMLYSAGFKNLTSKNINLQLKVNGYFEFNFKDDSKRKQSFTKTKKINLSNSPKDSQTKELIFSFGNHSDIIKISNGNNAILYINNSNNIFAPTSIPSSGNKEYYIYDIEGRKKVKVKDNGVNNNQDKKAWWHFSYVSETIFKLYYEEKNQKIKEIINNGNINYIGTHQQKSGNGILMWDTRTTNINHNSILDINDGKWKSLGKWASAGPGHSKGDFAVKDKLVVYKFKYVKMNNLGLDAYRKSQNSIIRFTNGMTEAKFVTLGFIQEQSRDGILLYASWKGHSIYDKTNGWHEFSKKTIGKEKLKVYQFDYTNINDFILDTKLDSKKLIIRWKGIKNMETLGEIRKKSNNGILLYGVTTGNSLYDQGTHVWHRLKNGKVAHAKWTLYKFTYTNKNNMELLAKRFLDDSVIRFQNVNNFDVLGKITKATSKYLLLYKDQKNYYNSLYDINTGKWSTMAENYIKTKLKPFRFIYNGYDSTKKEWNFELDAERTVDNTIVLFRKVANSNGINEKDYQTLGKITARAKNYSSLAGGGEGIILYDSNYGYNNIIYDTKSGMWAEMGSKESRTSSGTPQLTHVSDEFKVLRFKYWGFNKWFKYNLDVERIIKNDENKIMRFKSLTAPSSKKWGVGLDFSKTLGIIRKRSRNGMILYYNDTYNSLYDKKTGDWKELRESPGGEYHVELDNLDILGFDYTNIKDFTILFQKVGTSEMASWESDTNNYYTQGKLGAQQGRRIQNKGFVKAITYWRKGTHRGSVWKKGGVFVALVGSKVVTRKIRELDYGVDGSINPIDIFEYVNAIKIKGFSFNASWIALRTAVDVTFPIHNGSISSESYTWESSSLFNFSNLFD